MGMSESDEKGGGGHAGTRDPTGWVREENGAFRRETIHSMLRRLPGWDYCGRAIYQITIALADQSGGALGRLEVEGPGGWVPAEAARAGREPYRPGEIEARVVASKIGEVVKACWEEIGEQWPGVRTLGFRLMPDHVHGYDYASRLDGSPLEQGRNVTEALSQCELWADNFEW